MSRIVMIAGLALALTGSAALAQPAGNGAPADQSASQMPPAPPPPPPASRDQYCRSAAASQTGYKAGDSASQSAYGDAYYACMDQEADNAPPPQPSYYGAPYPYPYPYPYAYPYSYYGGPYYGGPGIGLSFGFGGGRGWHR